MGKQISIIIDNVRYDRVKAKTCLSCNECDLEHLCDEIESNFPIVCYELSEMDSIEHIFKKAEK